jgi:hypothetical protein
VRGPGVGSAHARGVRARPAATRGMARVRSAGAAHDLGRAARACARRMAHGVSARAAMLLGEPATTRRRRTGDGGDDDSSARRRRRGETATGGRGGGSGDVSAPDCGGREAGSAHEAVGTRRLGRDGGAREEAAVGERAGAECAARSGRAVPTALKTALSAWHVAATQQWRTAAWARHGVRRLTSGVRLSVISELKNISKEISSN